ncbi:MAG: polysaccharide deacetylase family protein [Alistipes sp.]|jgi:peptidoglycan/xylan/chitin deacetylase (PgdA/CDA1 family)|nr:polysaccharide deacetylase family protein [Alistipes sp.]
MRFKPPLLLRRLFPSLVWSIPGSTSKQDSGEVFLTFDDGPTPGVTEWILSQLDEYGARATFFCLGKNVERHPELCRRILEAGHRIGNHSYDHARGWEMSAGNYARSVEHAREFIDSDLFRPPYGRITRREARLLALHYRIVMWNVISRDYSRRVAPEKCLRNVVRHVRPGDIVVFHDSQKAFRNLEYALPRVLRFLQEQGMSSKTIEL